LNLFASPHGVVLIALVQNAAFCDSDISLLEGYFVGRCHPRKIDYGTNGKCPASMLISIIFDANVQAKHRFLHASRARTQAFTTPMEKDAFRHAEVGRVRN
jgi:adenine-specific DNA methylase